MHLEIPCYIHKKAILKRSHSRMLSEPLERVKRTFAPAVAMHSRGSSLGHSCRFVVAYARANLFKEVEQQLMILHLGERVYWGAPEVG